MFCENLLLRSLGPAIEHLRPYLSQQRFSAGQVIKTNGAAAERIFLPISGLISSRVVLETGHEIECALISKASATGVLGVLGLPEGFARFICLTDGEAWTIARSHLASAARAEPNIERQLTKFSIVQLGYAAHLGVCNAMHTSEQRLARWLASAAKILGRSDMTINQDELAAILGLQRSAVNPALQRLRTSGIIDIARGRISILDRERLHRRSCECLAPLSRALCGGHELLGAEPG